MIHSLPQLKAQVAGLCHVTRATESRLRKQTITRHQITLRRTQFDMSIETIGTDAFKAMSTIPGVSSLRIDSEEETEVSLSYHYSSGAAFLQTVEYLAPFWLERT
jgi:hypothetical protein